MNIDNLYMILFGVITTLSFIIVIRDILKIRKLTLERKVNLSKQYSKKTNSKRVYILEMEIVSKMYEPMVDYDRILKSKIIDSKLNQKQNNKKQGRAFLNQPQVFSCQN